MILYNVNLMSYGILDIKRVLSSIIIIYDKYILAIFLFMRIYFIVVSVFYTVLT